MADFLTNLLARNRGEMPAIGPRPAMRFESPASVPVPDEPVDDEPVDTTQSASNRQRSVVPELLSAPSPLPSVTAPPTPPETLWLAKEIGEKCGLRYVYTGNIPADNNTYCPRCKAAVFRRNGDVKPLHMDGNRCLSCGAEIDGVWP